MEQILAVIIGVLVAASVWLMLSRNVVRFLFGLVLISNAANLVIFTGGRLTLGAPPLIDDGAEAPPALVANALPQALVLTAIVIGFGLLAFALALVFRAYTALGTVDSDEMRLAEPVEGDAPPPTVPGDVAPQPAREAAE
jgi:multicomponent Na+:H+ antiporter subunit C